MPIYLGRNESCNKAVFVDYSELFILFDLGKRLLVRINIMLSVLECYLWILFFARFLFTSMIYLNESFLMRNFFKFHCNQISS